MPASEDGEEGEESRPHLTRRDLHANPLEDLFDFEAAPSLQTKVGRAALPADDCSPLPQP